MAETVSVQPTPIQRNKFDVAIELIQLHKECATIDQPVQAEELEGLFTKYYALATYLERNSVRELQNLVSEELLAKVGKFK